MAGVNYEFVLCKHTDRDACSVGFVERERERDRDGTKNYIDLFHIIIV